MNLPSRETRLAIILLLTLTALSVLVTIFQTTVDGPTLLTTSNSSNGGKALRLWLEELGLNISTETLDEFVIPNDVDLVLLLEPSTQFTLDEIDEIERWVTGGGTLLIAASQPSLVSGLLNRLGFELTTRFPDDNVHQRQSPIFSGSLDWDSAEFRVTYEVESEWFDTVTHLAANEAPFVVSVPYGQGHIFVSSVTTPMTNIGLQADGNAGFALTLIETAYATTDQDGAIWFNEWHHGIRNSDGTLAVGPWAWLSQTRPGNSIIYAGAIAFLFIAFHGRKFGRPIPLATTKSRRAPLEYITAIANLNRRSGNRQAILNDYKHRLKRHFGQRYRVDPTLADGDYLAQLKAANPDLDELALRDLLGRLNNRNIDENGLVKVTAEVAEILK